MNPREFKAKTPLSVIVPAVLIAGGVAAFIIFATWQSAEGVMDSKKTGTIIAKEFKPEPEKQLIVDRKGNLTTQYREGDYIVTVDVPQSDGTQKRYKVWMPDKPSYDALKIGDAFDVGPVLVPEKK